MASVTQQCVTQLAASHGLPPTVNIQSQTTWWVVLEGSVTQHCASSYNLRVAGSLRAAGNAATGGAGEDVGGVGGAGSR